MNEYTERERMLDKKEHELNARERELQDWAREILERERAVMVKEEEMAKYEKENSFDYLFDTINMTTGRRLTPEYVIMSVNEGV